MADPTAAALQKIRASVELVGGLSDSLIRLGPFSLGLDGILSWVPGVGEVYGAAAAAFLLVQGARARVPLPMLLGACALMSARTTLTAVPLIGPLFSDLFTAHRWSARMIVHAIDRRLQGQDDEAGYGRGGHWRERAA